MSPDVETASAAASPTAAAAPTAATAAVPTFSVVIPTHQSRDFVVAAIRSVLAQTDQDFEIVVFDNGSSDDTGAAVAALGDPRIIYCWQEDSGLPADSRNKAMAHATGDWIAFLDADDSWRPGKLAAVRAAISADPGLDAVCHDVDIVNLAGVRTGERVYTLDDRPAWEQLLYRGNFLTTSAMTVRTRAIRDAGGFDIRPEYFTVEDYDLWMRLAVAGSRFAIISQKLGDYLVHAGGASNRLVRHYDALARVFDDHAIAAARAGRLDVSAAVARRRRSRLAEARDLARRGAWGDSIRVIAALPGESLRARDAFRAAAADPREDVRP